MLSIADRQLDHDTQESFQRAEDAVDGDSDDWAQGQE